METQYSLDPTEQNEDSYEDLLVSIEASEGMLSLLIAVCDDSEFRERIIERYTADLQPTIRPYRVTLARGEPSLRAAIAELVQGDEYLRSGGRAVLTVTGVEKLYFIKLGADRSEQEIFFGYLQWTREGLREFPFPIVLWMTNQIQRELSKKAPDFWSWRKGVFRFVSKKTGAIPSREFAKLPLAPDERKVLAIDDDDSNFIPLQDLQELIQQTEQKRGRKDSSLATLYARMGQIYRRRLDRAESQDYQAELALAIEYYRKAAGLQQELGLEEDLSSTLSNLAGLYYAQGRYKKAEPLFLQALALRKCLLGDNHRDVATTLHNLAVLYYAQGRYEEAEPLFLQALELYIRLLGYNHPYVATSLNNLVYLYSGQGRYNEAEPLLRQALELRKRLRVDNHPDVATSSDNRSDSSNNPEAEPAEPVEVAADHNHDGQVDNWNNPEAEPAESNSTEGLSSLPYLLDLEDIIPEPSPFDSIFHLTALLDIPEPLPSYSIFPWELDIPELSPDNHKGISDYPNQQKDHNYNQGCDQEEPLYEETFELDENRHDELL